VIKGQCETALLNLSREKEFLSLKVYSVRAGYVDRKNDTEVIQAIKSTSRTQGLLMDNVVEPVILPVLRAVWPKVICPTPELGQFLINLATGDGAPFPTQPGISGEGRTIENDAMRRILKNEK